MQTSVYKSDTSTKTTSKDTVSRKANDPTEGLGNQAYSSFFGNSTISSPSDAHEQEAVSSAKNAMDIHRSAADSSDFMGNMESSFGMDFSGVSFHHDSHANELSRSIDANAFTKGNDIYFAENQYQPDTSEGQELIAHELTHVAQNNGGESVSRSVAGNVISRKDGDETPKPNPASGASTTPAPDTSTTPAPDASTTPAPATASTEDPAGKAEFETAKTEAKTAYDNLKTNVDNDSAAVTAGKDAGKFQLPQNATPDEVEKMREKQAIVTAATTAVTKITEKKDALEIAKRKLSEAKGKWSPTEESAQNELQKLETDIETLSTTTKDLLDQFKTSSVADTFNEDAGIAMGKREDSFALDTLKRTDPDLADALKRPLFRKFVSIMSTLKEYESAITDLITLLNDDNDDSGKEAVASENEGNSGWDYAGLASNTITMGTGWDAYAQEAKGKKTNTGSNVSDAVGNAGAAVASSAGVVQDYNERGNKKNDRAQKMAKMDMKGPAELDGTEDLRLIASAVGATGDISGLVGSIGNAAGSDGVDNGFGIASDALGTVSNFMEMGADVADKDKHQKHNENALKQMSRHVQQAKNIVTTTKIVTDGTPPETLSLDNECIIDPISELADEAIPAKLRQKEESSDTNNNNNNTAPSKTSPIFNKYRKIAKKASDQHSNASEAKKKTLVIPDSADKQMKQAERINKTREVSKEQGYKSRRGAILSALKTLASAGGLVGSTMSAFGNGKVGKLISAISSSVGLVLDAVDIGMNARKSKDAHNKQTEQTQKTVNIVLDAIEALPRKDDGLKPSDLSVGSLPETLKNDKKTAALSDYYGVSLMLESANVSVFDFMYQSHMLSVALSGTDAGAIKEAQLAFLKETAKGMDI